MKFAKLSIFLVLPIRYVCEQNWSCVIEYFMWQDTITVLSEAVSNIVNTTLSFILRSAATHEYNVYLCVCVCVCVCVVSHALY